MATIIKGHRAEIRVWWKEYQQINREPEQVQRTKLDRLGVITNHLEKMGVILSGVAGETKNRKNHEDRTNEQAGS